MVAFAPVAEPSALRLAVWPEQSRRLPASPGVRRPRYIDAPVCRDEDKNSDGDCIDPKTDPDPAENEGDEHLYYCQDANFNTTALVDGYDGAVVERYMYDPYGKVSVRHGVRDSGGTDTSESEWDERTSNTFDNEILYCGYRYDPETGLYHVRHRMYHPTLGRWMTRDRHGDRKQAVLRMVRLLVRFLQGTVSDDGHYFMASERAEYKDGNNLYQYVKSAPTGRTDASGLQSEDSSSGPLCCGPEIGKELRRVIDKVQNSWNRATPKERDENCSALYSLSQHGSAWEIDQLAPPDHEASDIKSGPCKHTVAVDGKCHHAGDVNYILWGKTNKLCKRWLFTAKTTAFAWKSKSWFREKIIGPGMMSRSRPYMPFHPGYTGWTTAGYNGTYSVTTPAEYRKCIVRENHEYRFYMTWHWGRGGRL